MNGVNLAEALHVSQLLVPQSISGGKTAQAVSTKGAEHITLLVCFGAKGAANPTSIILNQCTDAAGDGPVAMPFRYYIQSNAGAGNLTAGGEDVFDSGPNLATASGITTFPTSIQNVVYAIEVDAAELEDTGLPYLQVVINDSGNTTLASVIAVLSGLRFAYEKSPSQTV